MAPYFLLSGLQIFIDCRFFMTSRSQGETQTFDPLLCVDCDRFCGFCGFELFVVKGYHLIETTVKIILNEAR